MDHSCTSSRTLSAWETAVMAAQTRTGWCGQRTGKAGPLREVGLCKPAGCPLWAGAAEGSCHVREPSTRSLPKGQPQGSGAKKWEEPCLSSVGAKSRQQQGEPGGLAPATASSTQRAHTCRDGVTNPWKVVSRLLFFIFPFKLGLQFSKMFSYSFDHYNSERVVPSQMTTGWAPLAMM